MGILMLILFILLIGAGIGSMFLRKEVIVDVPGVDRYGDPVANKVRKSARRLPLWVSALPIAAAVGLVIFASIFSIERVTGGQIGVELKGSTATTFSGWNVLGPTSKTVVFDAVIPLELDIELVDGGEKNKVVPGPRTIQVKDSDGQPAWLDMRVVVALNSECGKKRCFTETDLAEVGALGYQFRKSGQSGLEELTVGLVQQSANLASGEYSADAMVNTDRENYAAAVNDAVRDALTARGFDVIDVVIQEVRLSEVNQKAVEALAVERNNQRVETAKAATAKAAADGLVDTNEANAAAAKVENDAKNARRIADEKAAAEALEISSSAEKARIEKIEAGCGCEYTEYLQALGISAATDKVIYTDGSGPVLTDRP
jgi:regulator of protease activity HflC (stomatin/prohibitin superfamily)